MSNFEIPVFDSEVEKERLYRDGVTSLKQAFDRKIGGQLLHDYGLELAYAQQHEYTKNRGRNRIWFPARPQNISAFETLVTHPYVTGVSEAVLGPEYQVVELGFDEPRQGALDQPWHRDYPIQQITREQGLLDSVAFNITLKDVEPDMGPFEIMPGTQFVAEPDVTLARDMFIRKRHYPQIVQDYPPQKRMGRLGDIQARTPLTFHRGTVHTSPETRPVMILGVCRPEVETSVHSLPMTRQWFESQSDWFQEFMNRHVRYQLMDVLGPVMTPGTDVEELMMGGDENGNDRVPF